MANEINRRDFIGSSTAGLATLGGITFLARPERVMGANDRVRVAICGVHGRGRDHLHNFSQVKNAEVAALCDIDENVLRQRLAQMDKMGVADTAKTRYTTDPTVAVGSANLTLALIMKEKYVATFLSPVTWDDMRRMDYAYTDFNLPVNAVLPTFIRRVNYPTNELSRNGKNVPSVEKTDHLWWDQ